MSFFAISELYDEINGSSYKPYAEFLDSAFQRADIKVNEVLDLGCGTGGICALLADKGYDMIGLDASPEMLNIAMEKNFGKNTLLLCQDMREFELYGTVQAVYSSFDCLNYLTEKGDLEKVFALVHNYLESGGVFIFDVNTEYRYRNIPLICSPRRMTVFIQETERPSFKGFTIPTKSKKPLRALFSLKNRAARALTDVPKRKRFIISSKKYDHRFMPCR